MWTELPVDSLHQHLNSVDPNIQFTVEKEKDGQLAFLDILLSRDSEGSISTSVYRKPTHTDQYLNFQSHHPVAHKRSVVRTLMSRAESLSHHLSMITLPPRKTWKPPKTLSNSTHLWEGKTWETSHHLHTKYPMEW